MKNNFYFEFENEFRGKRENIIEKLSIYDHLLKTLSRNSNRSKILDLGCGRGEWLEKCREYDLDCLGIDSDEEMTQYCIDKGFNIIQADVFEQLPLIKNNSYSLISCFHIIEHLSNEKLFKFLSEILRILRDDGILLMETPSIDNLIVSSKTFYLDPTHINHINPDRIIFTLNNMGFYSSKYFYINSGPLFNADHMKITRILNGVGQDIMFVAFKVKLGSHKFSSDLQLWIDNLPKSLSTLQAASQYDLSFDNKIEQLYDQILDLKNLVNSNQDQIEELKNISKKRFTYKISKKLKSALFHIRTLIKKLFFILIDLLYKFIKLLKVHNNTFLKHLIYYMLIFLIKSLKKLGFEYLSNFIESKFEVTKIFKVKSKKINDKLENHFSRSEEASLMYGKLFPRDLFNFHNKK